MVSACACRHGGDAPSSSPRISGKRRLKMAGFSRIATLSLLPRHRCFRELASQHFRCCPSPLLRCCVRHHSCGVVRHRTFRVVVSQLFRPAALWQEGRGKRGLSTAVPSAGTAVPHCHRSIRQPMPSSPVQCSKSKNCVASGLLGFRLLSSRSALVELIALEIRVPLSGGRDRLHLMCAQVSMPCFWVSRHRSGASCAIFSRCETSRAQPEAALSDAAFWSGIKREQHLKDCKNGEKSVK